MHFRFRFRDLGQGEESDAAPPAIELAPGGDAVEIAHVLELFEGVEFFPGKCPRVFYQPTYFQSPIGQCDLRFDAEIENGESLREMLARRESVRRARRRFRFSGHLARPTLLALDQGWVRRAHEEL